MADFSSLVIGNNTYDVKDKIARIQKSALPTASSTEEGNIYQYIGATAGGLTNGYFYKCVNNNGTYSWIAVDVQAGSGSTVQSDWSQTDDTAADYIKSKPTSMPASDVSAWAKASTKPSYTASEVGAIATTAKGAANGVAELDSAGKVPSSQLPSFVDDVLEYDAKSSFPATGETGKIYVDKTTNLTWRWSGTAYVEISPSLALGETSSTAYAGDKGKANADNISTIQGLIPSNATTSNKLATAGDIPTVNNATLTIQKNGTNVQTFTANQSSNATANITVPTKVSELTNDSGFTTNTGTVTKVKVGTTDYNPSSGVVSLPAYPTTLPASDTTSSYSASGTVPVNGTAVAAALGTLDVSEVGGSGKYIQKISETDGKISATAADLNASAVGLGNVGNFKAVSTAASQGLTTTEQSNARANIGAGTSSLTIGTTASTAAAGNHTHDYSSTYAAKSHTHTKSQITDFPTLGTAAAKDVASSGNASTTQVVMGNDTRLSDARTPTSHNQASDTINAMTGYSKPSSTSAITTSDTLNSAIGKLELALDSKVPVITTDFDMQYKTSVGDIVMWNGTEGTKKQGHFYRILSHSGGSSTIEEVSPLTFDSTPTQNSTNPVTSGGVYTALQNAGGGGGDTIGDIKMTACATAPSGWMICDGSAISRETYADLFTAIGTSYGTGNGSTTFNIPNFKGKAAFGLNSSDTSFKTLGKSSGAKTVTLSTNNLPSHTHTYIPSVNYVTNGGDYQAFAGYPFSTEVTRNFKTGTLSGSQQTTDATGSGTAVDKMPPYLVVNYIIYTGVTA